MEVLEAGQAAQRLTGHLQRLATQIQAGQSGQAVKGGPDHRQRQQGAGADLKEKKNLYASK